MSKKLAQILEEEGLKTAAPAAGLKAGWDPYATGDWQVLHNPQGRWEVYLRDLPKKAAQELAQQINETGTQSAKAERMRGR
jgi:hypothetical protein